MGYHSANQTNLLKSIPRETRGLRTYAAQQQLSAAAEKGKQEEEKGDHLDKSALSLRTI